MQEFDRKPKYRKDVDQEQRLKRVNEILFPFEKQLISGFSKPQLPIVFIVGVPRSGTTLLSQILAQTEAFSYVSNYVARFWMAPYLGLLIESAFGTKKKIQPQFFASKYGITEDRAGPHEFGYFWSRWFNFRETHKLTDKDLKKIDKETLQKELAALESVYNRPLFFKNLTCGLQVKFLADLFKRSIFIQCYRHPLYNMQSLLLTREEILGDKRYWCSLRPKEYPELLALSPYDQIAGQVFYSLKEIEAAFALISPKRFLRIKYNDLCTQPRVEVNKIVESVNQLGCKIKWKHNAIPEKFKLKDFQQVGDKEFQKLHKAAEKLFNLDV